MENVQKQNVTSIYFVKSKSSGKMGGSSSGIKEQQAFKRCNKTCYSKLLLKYADRFGNMLYLCRNAR